MFKVLVNILIFDTIAASQNNVASSENIYISECLDHYLSNIFRKTV